MAEGSGGGDGGEGSGGEGGGPFDQEVTWSGAKVEFPTTKRIRIIYRPASIAEIAWDVPEGPVDEERKPRLTTKDLPDGAQAVIEVYRTSADILAVEVKGPLAFEEAAKIVVKTLGLPDGTPLTVDVYRRALPSVATEDDSAPVHRSRLPKADDKDKDMLLSRDLEGEPDDEQLRADVHKVVDRYLLRTLAGINSTAIPDDKGLYAAVGAMAADAVWILALAAVPEAVGAGTAVKLAFNTVRSSLKPDRVAGIVKKMAGVGTAPGMSPKEFLVMKTTEILGDYAEKVDLADLRRWLKEHDKLGGAGSSAVRDEGIWEYCFGDRITYEGSEKVVTEAQALAREFLHHAPRVQKHQRVFGHIDRTWLKPSVDPESKYEYARDEDLPLSSGGSRPARGSESEEAWIGERLADFHATVAILSGLIKRKCYAAYVTADGDESFKTYSFPHRRVKVWTKTGGGQEFYYEHEHEVWDGPWKFE